MKIYEHEALKKEMHVGNPHFHAIVYPVTQRSMVFSKPCHLDHSVKNSARANPIVASQGATMALLCAKECTRQFEKNGGDVEVFKSVSTVFPQIKINTSPKTNECPLKINSWLRCIFLIFSLSLCKNGEQIPSFSGRCFYHGKIPNQNLAGTQVV